MACEIIILALLVKPSNLLKTDYIELVMACHKNMIRNNLHLLYEGEINQAITKTFTALAEQNLIENNEDSRVVRNVYHVMVECLQNIYKHTDPAAGNRPGKRSYGIILIGKDDNGYIVSTGNSVVKSQEVQLKKILDNINSMSTSELNDLYKVQIRNGVISEKGGAGLGFIDISRKTGSKLEYKFETIDEKNSFFILKTYIAK